MIMFVGVAMYGVLLGSITQLIQKDDLSTADFEEKMAQMVHYSSLQLHRNLSSMFPQLSDSASMNYMGSDQSAAIARA